MGVNLTDLMGRLWTLKREHRSLSLFIYLFIYFWPWASQVAQMVKNPPAKWETWVQALNQEDPLEKRMVTHSIILAWKIPCSEEPGKLQSMSHKT